MDEVTVTSTQTEVLAKPSLQPEPADAGKIFELIPVASSAELLLIEELRAAVMSALGSVLPLPTDHPDMLALFAKESLLRFLRARSSIAASATMVKDSLKWRVSYNLFSNIAEWYADESSEAEFLRRTWPCGCHGKDKRGVPVYYARYGLADMAASVEAAGFDRFLRFSLSQSYEGWVGCDKASLEHGKHQVTMICVADMGGLEWRKAMRAVPYFKRFAKVMDDNFPEKLHVAYVVNAPRIFSTVYRLLAPFLAADTKAKVRVFGKGDDHLHAKGGLLEHMELEQVPPFLGGTSPSCTIPEPGMEEALKAVALS